MSPPTMPPASGTPRLVPDRAGRTAAYFRVRALCRFRSQSLVVRRLLTDERARELALGRFVRTTSEGAP